MTMERFKISTLIFLSIFAFMTSCSSSDSEDDIFLEVSDSTSDFPAFEKDVLTLVNEHRTSEGLNPLEYGHVAYDFADSHNKYMISEGKISHDNFNLRSSNLSVKAKADSVSENVAKDFVNAKGVVRAWINSATHKKVIEGDFTHSAISIKADNEGVLYFTQLFYKK